MAEYCKTGKELLSKWATEYDTVVADGGDWLGKLGEYREFDQHQKNCRKCTFKMVVRRAERKRSASNRRRKMAQEREK